MQFLLEFHQKCMIFIRNSRQKDSKQIKKSQKKERNAAFCSVPFRKFTGTA